MTICASLKDVRRQRPWNRLRHLHKGVFLAHRHHSGVNDETDIRLSALLEGVPRDDVETALSHLLDDIEQQIAENEVMGGPPQGTA